MSNIDPKVQNKKKSNGRRSNKYFSHVLPRLETIKAWKRKGYTEKSICAKLRVGVSNWEKYKTQYEELKEALKEGLDDTVALVEMALLKSATGFYMEDDVVVGQGENRRVETVRKFYPPFTEAQKFYLKNRGARDWKDRMETGLTGPNGEPLQNQQSVVIFLPDNNRKSTITAPESSSRLIPFEQPEHKGDNGNGNGNGNGNSG
jgi:hypothetical protein